jgi:phosphoribosylanthranilate isomerase
MKIKLCGFRDEESLKVAVKQKCDFLGFIFCDKSPRNISLSQASALLMMIPSDIKKVAVVVDATFEFLQKIIDNLSPDFLQFHGSEDIQFLKEFRQKFPQIKIIKAFRINNEADLELVKNFEDYCDLFLFDGQNPGSGEKFNLEILKDFKSKKDWFLAGGINIDNVLEMLQISGAKMIDISSGIEEIRGTKSPKLIIEFMNKVRSLC